MSVVKVNMIRKSSLFYDDCDKNEIHQNLSENPCNCMYTNYHSMVYKALVSVKLVPFVCENITKGDQEHRNSPRKFWSVLQEVLIIKLHENLVDLQNTSLLRSTHKTKPYANLG